MSPFRFLSLLAVALALAACGPDKTASLPPPQEPGPDAVGVTCHMALSEHQGPKGQAFLKGDAAPLWFSSVRDVVGWLLEGGAGKPVVAVYVNDMGRARQWEQPEAGTWVELHAAILVVGSDKSAAMGGGELVPFGERSAAEAFTREHGGRLLSFGQIDRAVLEQTGQAAVGASPGHGHHGGAGDSPGSGH